VPVHRLQRVEGSGNREEEDGAEEELAALHDPGVARAGFTADGIS
jgi:hypothetical protein